MDIKFILKICLRYVLFLNLIFLLVILSQPNPLIAESYDGKLVPIPFDEKTPEGLLLRKKGQVTKKASKVARRYVPIDLFVSVFNLSKISRKRTKSILTPLNINPEKLTEHALKNTIWDVKDKLWFDTDYRPLLDVSLYCSWTYDPNIEGRQRAIEKEKSLNAAQSKSRAPERPLILPTQDEPSEEMLAMDHHSDGELRGHGELLHKFRFAGASCTISSICNKNSTMAKKKMCNIDFLETLAETMIVAQRGAR